MQHNLIMRFLHRHFPTTDAYLYKALAGVREIHFLPFNPTDKRTALTYLDADSRMHRVSKGAPEQVINQKLYSNQNSFYKEI